ncbi:uncharacterized protein LOC119070651 [Bradysia coprophila]|uniref:uncharacterized protein LOC119070651 n=1 Tax=Bradysia coprophila TaxID=38358 RepID=UPI00187D94EF|nr:uncharacterized protein LOC119070651 [Bradysia coprophila]
MEATFSIVCFFQQKEFVGQKSLRSDIEAVVSGECVSDIITEIWEKAAPLIKREVIVKGDEIEWSEDGVPTQADFANFIILQDRGGRKAYLFDQINTTILARLRNKHVNVMVHVYGRQICNKSVHGRFVSKLLQPEQRDRANANSTQSLMAMVELLKQTHKGVYAANVSIWQMWANAIQSAAPHLQDEMITRPPPPHLIHMFIRASTSEADIRESMQRGLQVADDLNDVYAGHLAKIREDFDKIRNEVTRAFEFVDARITSFEDVVNSNRRIVSAMSSAVTPQPNAISMEEERQITDLEDMDHN